MKQMRGFTVIELVAVIVFTGLVAGLLLVQQNSINAAQRDTQRKTAINAMYYNLEEVFYEKNGYYPSEISSNNLTAMDEDLFTDPFGTPFGEAGSSYHYNPSNCANEKCKSYTLSAELEKEATYKKESRH